MIYKTIHTGSYDFGVQPVSLVDIHSRGVDKSWMQKRAMALGPELETIRPELNKTALHIIAMGATEDFGANRNSDGFRRQPLRDRHHTFVKNGHVFKSHKNKNPKEASGSIKFSAFNEPMKRVELIISVDNTKWAGELEKLANGEDLSFSMAARVPEDVCSICANRAPTRENYCYVPGTLIKLADGREKPIENVAVGDYVIDAEGLPTRVIKIFSREIDEEIEVIDTTLRGVELRLTGNHPILTSPYEDNMCPFYFCEASSRNPTCVRGTKVECGSCRKHDSKFDYTRADLTRKGDMVLSPKLHTLINDHVGNKIDGETAWVYGLFMAEGCYAKIKYTKKNGDTSTKFSSTCFSLHRDEGEIIDRLRAFFRLRFSKEIKLYYPKRSKGVCVRVHSKTIAELFYSTVGECARVKYLNERLLSELSNATVESFLSGYFDGDGHKYTRNSRVNSASPDLINQVCELVKLLGYTAYVGKPVVVPGGPSNRTNKFDQHYLITDFRPGRKKAKHRARWNTPKGTAGFIRSRKQERYIGLVHNIETESGSYIANSIASHNCDHMKKMAGQILSDGRMVYVDNPEPDFFDISGVFRPADRIAYQLQKVASASVLTGADLAELDGLVPDFSIPAPLHSSNLQWQKRATLRKLAEIEKEIEAVAPGCPGSITDLGGAFAPEMKGVSDDDLNGLSSCAGGRINKLMGALGRVRVSLPLRDFIQVVMGGETGDVSTSDIEQRLPGIFSRMLEEGNGDEISDGTYDPAGGLSGLPSGVRSIIDKMIPGMSLAEGPAQKRITMVIVRKIPKPKLTPGSEIRNIKEATDNAGAELLAKEYAKYKLSFLAHTMEKEGSELLVRLGVLQNYLQV